MRVRESEYSEESYNPDTFGYKACGKRMFHIGDPYVINLVCPMEQSR